MQLRIPTLDQLRSVYDAHLKRSFPPEELRPLRSIEEQWQAGEYRPWCLYDDDDIVGECFLWLGEPGWALVDYLCVSPRCRNSGLGALMLSMIREREPGLILFGESEAPEDAPDPAMAQRRLDFYARNGLRTAGYDTDIFGAHYKTLYMGDREVRDEELIRQHRLIYEARLAPAKYAKYVHSPWDPKKPISPKVAWNE